MSMHMGIANTTTHRHTQTKLTNIKLEICVDRPWGFQGLSSLIILKS